VLGDIFIAPATAGSLLRCTILNIAKRNRGGGVYASFLIYDNKNMPVNLKGFPLDHQVSQTN
ncbi:hypothetical protein, partial [Morganella morganii]|uniref:hypothetical protein n=1 Tax=Morganella morganii TaxID=582 RepID=UPI001952A3D8